MLFVVDTQPYHCRDDYDNYDDPDQRQFPHTKIVACAGVFVFTIVSVFEELNPIPICYFLNIFRTRASIKKKSMPAPKTIDSIKYKSLCAGVGPQQIFDSLPNQIKPISDATESHATMFESFIRVIIYEPQH